VQRVLGHATASMTLDLYGHLMDANLWATAKMVGDRLGIAAPKEVINFERGAD
jgi:integrase